MQGPLLSEEAWAGLVAAAEAAAGPAGPKGGAEGRGAPSLMEGSRRAVFDRCVRACCRRIYEFVRVRACMRFWALAEPLFERVTDC